MTDRRSADIGEAPLMVWAIRFAAVSVVMTGYHVYVHNQALQIPLVRLLNDPSLYPNDPFAATLPHYASSVWRLVALCARIVPLEPLLLGLFLVERVTVMYAAGSLAFAFAPKSRLAAAAAMAFFATDPTPLLGGGTLLMPYFEQTSLAVTFLMLAMAAFHKQRPLAWALWLAAGFHCNSLYGVYALTYFGASWVVSVEHRKEWRHWMSALAIFAALSSPVIWLSITAFGKSQAGSSLWIAACRTRLAHHLFPSTWPLIRFARFAALVLLVVGTTALARTSLGLRRQILAWITVGAGWVAAAIAAEQLRLPSMLILQPARATDLLCAYGVIALVATCAAAEAPAVLALVPLAFSLFHPYAGWALVLVGVLLLLLRNVRLDYGRLAWGTAAVVAIAALSWRAAVNGSGSGAIAGTCSRSSRLLCRWARTATPKGSVFLVNPNMSEFRALSARPVFATWKDGSALLWDRQFASHWCRRMKALGCDVSRGKMPNSGLGRRLDRLYGKISDSDVRGLAARYRIDFWVTAADHASALRVVYANRYFKVLRLKQRATKVCARPIWGSVTLRVCPAEEKVAGGSNIYLQEDDKRDELARVFTSGNRGGSAVVIASDRSSPRSNLHREQRQ